MCRGYLGSTSFALRRAVTVAVAGVDKVAVTGALLLRMISSANPFRLVSLPTAQCTAHHQRASPDSLCDKYGG